MSAFDHVWKRAGGFAFPSEYESGGPDSGKVTHHGMTRRDYFAAHAPATPGMETFKIKQWTTEEIGSLGNGLRGPKKVFHTETWAERDARWAVEYADAMIAAMEKE